MVNTLVYNPLVYKGFQWLLYNGTLVINLGYNGGVHVALFRAWSSTCQYRVTRG
jgi:hypothetical protein